MDAKNRPHRQLELPGNSHGVRFGFICTELDLAITFCQIALSTRDHDRFERNISNAQSAYTAAKHFMAATDLSVSQRKKIREQLVQLDELLGQLNCDLGRVKGVASFF